MPAHATRFGKPLPPGGTIGVPAPASPAHNRSDVLRGVEWWESRGYHVTLSDGIYARDDWVAGDARQRAHDVEAMFADPAVDVVQCAGGGYGSAQLIPHLDFGLIADNPKPVADYKAGKQASLMFLVGQVMKATRGKANAQDVRAILERLLAL